MKNRIVRRQLIVALILVLLISPSQSAQAYTGLHNATEKKDVTAWGAWGYITWTDPNLNGGEWSYHRVVVFQQSPWRYVEWGWQKTKTELRGLIVYNAGSGDIMAPISGVSAATHRYSMQYDSNTSKYWFYLDGSNVYNINANFSSGTGVAGGGEVATGVESMGHTMLYDLRYLMRNPDGTFSYALWGGHVDYLDDSPYYNTDNGSNSFYNDGP